MATRHGLFQRAAKRIVGTRIVGGDVAQPLLNTVGFESVHDERSNELAGMPVVELGHSEKCMLESTVCTDKPGVD